MNNDTDTTPEYKFIKKKLPSIKNLVGKKRVSLIHGFVRNYDCII